MASFGAKAIRKWLLAGVVLTLIALSLWHFEPELPQRIRPQNPESANGLSSEQQDAVVDPNEKKEDLPHIPQWLRGKTLDLTKIDSKPLSLESDLHELKTNDEFLPYLASISDVQNLSVPEAFGTCDFTEEETLSFMYNGDAKWKLDLLSDSEIESLRTNWQHFIKHGLIPWEAVKDRYNGRGMVIVGGYGKDVNRIKVALRAMKKHGSQMPVEINYFGDELKDTTRKELVDIYGDEIFFNDLSDEEQPWGTFMNVGPWLNYQLKTAAMVNSRFSEILLLDSDNIPTADPMDLFESKAYKEYGSVFWPDHPRTRKEHPAWAAFNTPCRRAEYEFETGQLLVDKRRNFYHLQLTAWMNTQPYWREVLLGDKDLFRYAWHALKTEFGTPIKWLTSLGFYAEQADGEGSKLTYCGHTFGQAFPDHSKDDEGSGIAFLHGGALKTAGGPLLARLRKLKGGVFTHFKRVKIETLEDWSKVEWGVTLEHWNAGYYRNLTRDTKASDLINIDEDFDLDGMPIGEDGIQAMELNDEDMDRAVLCTDFKFVHPQPIAELGSDAAEFEKLFEQSGGYWSLEYGFRGW